jgi:tetratricopeptide (TPR) repeat protein
VVDRHSGGERTQRQARESRENRQSAVPHKRRAQAPARSGPDRARRAQPQHDDAAGVPPGLQGPPIPPGTDAKQLDPDIRRELSTLDRNTADYVAKHLVAAGTLLDDDPEAALAHAQAARTRSGRIGVVREAVGIAAYHCGDWAQALAELRAARRLGSRSALLALIADCERGVGRPERAIELSRTPEAAQLTGDDADELRIVVAGARADLGQLEQALAVLSSPKPDAARTGQTAARLCYALAEALLALGRDEEALQWFFNAAAADTDGVTDAEDRVGELT